MGTTLRWSTGLSVIVLLAGLIGCGTNLEEVLFQTAGATSRIWLDQLLTDAANNIAEAIDEGAAPDDEADGDEADGDDDGGVADDVPFDELTGDAAAGETFYATSCASCHCADASGGCAMSAPPVFGTSAELNDDFLRGDASHPMKSDVSNQDLVDLEAYLASLGG